MLKGKSVVVTGSTSGIGLAIARAFAKEGCNLTLNGFGDKSAIEKERAGIETEFGVKAIYSGADQVWTDAGCVSSQALVNRMLAAGASVRHTLIWNRDRSGPHCTTSSTSAGSGTYRLYVTVRGKRSAAAIFHLTG